MSLGAAAQALLGSAGVADDSVCACRALPADTEQTAALVRWARHERIPLAVGCALGCPEAVRVDLSRMRQVRFYEPQDLTLGVEAGLTAAELDAVLAASGQFVPLDVPERETARIGAILAAHRSGPLRQFYGTVRDFIIGIEFVAADGSIVHGGGRVVKNVAGYDLMRLQIGARGSLGVITAAHFKVFPRPAATETWHWSLAGWEQAEALRRAFLYAPLRPLALELSGPPLAVQVRFAGGEATRRRWQAELERLGAAVGVAPEVIAEESEFWRGYAASPADWRLVAPPAVALAAVRQLQDRGRDVRWRGRLALGVFELEAAALDADAASLPAEAWLAPADEPAAVALTPLMQRLRRAVGA